MSHEILHSLFSTYTEVHAAQLGVLLGLLVGIAYREHALPAYVLLFTGVVLAFGNAPVIGYGDITRKPWYFLSGVYAASVVAMLSIHFLTQYRQDATPASSHR